jgi:hypothetical protein
MRQKLDEHQVKAIKVLLNTGTMTHKQIGNVFGMSREQITKISNGKRWGDIVVGNKTIKRIVVVEYVDNDYEVREL